MEFLIIDRNDSIPLSASNTVFLRYDNWNDYSYVTMFYVTLFDAGGSRHDLGNVKIGFKGQVKSISTRSKLNSPFNNLPEDFFSLGMELEYYEKLVKIESKETKDEYLKSLCDIVWSEKHLEVAMGEDVFSTSLLRGVSLTAIKEQFKRVLEGGVIRTNFSFSYLRLSTDKQAGLELTFDVKSESKPSTNIHALIGRNGVGKTTILNGMIQAVTGGLGSGEGFFKDDFFEKVPIGADYFSSLVSVSFSAFDPFTPPPEQSDPAKGTCYYYVGLKKVSVNNSELKNLAEIHREYLKSLALCMSQPGKKSRWLSAIANLESDENFADMELSRLMVLSGQDFNAKAMDLIARMSSGHAIVLLTITKLVATVEEKTLVVIDEPESHLHPPLLSAFLRALSELLLDRNGVAIIATHSPVVLQEIPTSCSWKVNRSRLVIGTERPEVQTFGENVGVLTREVFGLEVRKSGFHKMLKLSVDAGGSFEQVLHEYGGQLGFEAQAIVRAMISSRDLEGGE
ncbi:AAA family ATPase [Pseudomonas sp. EA_105y_Pfl2_R69]|uniref:AAA family ATPase n=1 Tax=Pseudomonas sp. EA_105y_Pfl2_R69 TaxID=3088683 RepID=UPI0030D7B8D9